MASFKNQKQPTIHYDVYREHLGLVYNFDTQEKQPKKKGVWKEFFSELPGDIVVKNCFLTPASLTIYAQHANLKCDERNLID